MSYTFRSPEQTAYARLIEASFEPGLPLLAGAAAGLGKTHGYTIPLLTSGKKVAVVLSTRQLIEQYLESDALKSALRLRPGASVVALQPRRVFETDRQHREHRQKALAADLLVLTHAAAFIDSWHPGYAQLRQRDVVLFDEADLLADAGDLQSTFSIRLDVLEECGAQDKGHLEAAQAVKAKGLEVEDRAAAAAILYALDRPAWYKHVGREPDGSLTLTHQLPGRMLKRLVQEVPRCIFTSGTLQVFGDFKHFASSIGLPSWSPESMHLDPAHHGDLRVEVSTEELTVEAMAVRIMAAERPTLVLTTSHSRTRELGELCPGSVWRQPGEALGDALQRVPDNGIFIAAGAWSGLDAPRLRWKTVVIPFTPNGKPRELDGKFVTRYIDSKVVALRRTNQGLHRGLRTPDAKCTLMLLDPRSAEPGMRQAIPARFAAKVNWQEQSFLEGSPRMVSHMQREREGVALRNAAFRRYGAKCSTPGCDETLKAILDVHHTIPIELGARVTRVEDCQVLCKNCHGKEHYRLRLAEIEGAASRNAEELLSLS